MKALQQVLTSLMVFAVLSATGQSTEEHLQKLEESFQDNLAKIREPLDELDQLYEVRLKAIAEDRQKRGDLEQTLAIKKEAETFRDSTDNEIPENFGQLHDAREVYLRELEKRTPIFGRRKSELLRKHLDTLTDLQSKLTREGNLESALKVKSKIDELEKEEPIDSVQTGPVKIELFWERNYRGVSVLLEVPCQIDRFAQKPELKNDRLKSIRIPEGVKVTVATGAALEGKQETLTGDENNIELGGISSLKAESTGLGQ